MQATDDKPPVIPRWVRIILSLAGLLLLAPGAVVLADLILLFAGPWQVREMGDGPERPLWLILTVYTCACAGLTAYCVTSFRWVTRK
jgi:hypothetical protein